MNQLVSWWNNYAIQQKWLHDFIQCYDSQDRYFLFRIPKYSNHTQMLLLVNLPCRKISLRFLICLWVVCITFDPFVHISAFIFNLFVIKESCSELIFSYCFLSVGKHLAIYTQFHVDDWNIPKTFGTIQFHI